MRDSFSKGVLLTSTTGVAGMTALKEFRDLGFDVTVFEKRSDVGGVWTWTEDAESTTALKETKLCNNKYSVRSDCIIFDLILTGLHTACSKRLCYA